MVVVVVGLALRCSGYYVGNDGRGFGSGWFGLVPGHGTCVRVVGI